MQRFVKLYLPEQNWKTKCENLQRQMGISAYHTTWSPSATNLTEEQKYEKMYGVLQAIFNGTMKTSDDISVRDIL